MNVAELNEAVLQAVEAHALTPAAIEQVVAHGRERVARAERATMDEQTDLFGQLHVDRKRTRAIDLELLWRGSRVIELLNCSIAL